MPKTKTLVSHSTRMTSSPGADERFGSRLLYFGDFANRISLSASEHDVKAEVDEESRCLVVLRGATEVIRLEARDMGMVHRDKGDENRYVKITRSGVADSLRNAIYLEFAGRSGCESLMEDLERARPTVRIHEKTT